VYLLDTDTCSFVLSGRSERASQQFARCRTEDLLISSVTLGELLYGVENNPTERLKQYVARFLAAVKVEPYSANAATTFSKVKLTLGRAGQLIGPYDMQIAAQALSSGHILVTHNTREYSRIQGLQLDDWVTDVN
jgi:tRNA(fMet)-specific endonuclease VapC